MRRDVEGARSLCEKTKTPISEIFLEAMRWKNIAIEDLERVLATSRQEAAQTLKRGLWVIGTIGSLAPYVGLFGTVVGIIRAFQAMAEHGVTFSKPVIDPQGLRGWKDQIVGQLSGGLDGLARKRKVRVVTGHGEFLSAHHLKVSRPDDSGKPQVIEFEQCVIAAGSESAWLPFLPDDRRIMDSTGALELEELPARLLVIEIGRASCRERV